jgi:hypothetical protein
MNNQPICNKFVEGYAKDGTPVFGIPCIVTLCKTECERKSGKNDTGQNRKEKNND